MCKPPLPRLTRALALATALALAGCAAQPIAPFTRATFSADAAMAQHELYFQPRGTQLVPGEAGRLNAFLQSLVLGPEDDVLVFVGQSGSDVLDARRLATLRSSFAPTPARLRLATGPGFSRPEARADVVFVQVQRYDRVKVTCPNTALDTWERDHLTPVPDMGCANALNLANMTAAPRDLTAPRRLAGSSGVMGAAAVNRYWTDTVKSQKLDAVAGK